MLCKQHVEASEGEDTILCGFETRSTLFDNPMSAAKILSLEDGLQRECSQSIAMTSQPVQAIQNMMQSCTCNSEYDAKLYIIASTISN